MVERPCAFLFGGKTMKEKRFAELINEHVANYINSLAYELESAHDQLFDGFGFPMFGETAKHYHEQIYYRSYLESYTRKMINGILKSALEEDSFDVFSWPELEYDGLYDGYTNHECEKDFGFEFINRDLRVGYRYTDFKYDEVDKLLEQGKVDSFVLVIWEEKDEKVYFQYSDKPIRVLLLWELFCELFCELDAEEIKIMYDLFTSQVKAAVEQAVSLISLTTIPGFTPSYLYKTRSETVSIMLNDIESLASFFVRECDYKYIEEESKQLINNYNLKESFIDNGFANNFVGVSDFAKSFLTSEYLYRHFEGNPMFDYTPIVSGYLKSVEQLLNTVISSYLKKNEIIKDISKYTLGSYIEELNSNRVSKNVFRKELLPNKKTIIECLNSYKVESRNNLFHKDYFDSWEQVKEIRNNTLFLYVLLLGSVKLDLVKDDSNALGVLNLDYDYLFSEIDNRSEGLYSFILDGKEYTDMRKEPRNKGLEFDKNGQIKNTLVFKRLEYDCYETVEISRIGMPTKLWVTNPSNKIKKKLWPIN